MWGDIMKIFDVVMVIVSAIALLGSLVTMYILVQVGGALNLITASETSQFIDPATLSTFVQTINTVSLFGWVWAISVFLSSLYAGWLGIKRMRAKGKS